MALATAEFGASVDGAAELRFCFLPLPILLQRIPELDMSFNQRRIQRARCLNGFGTRFARRTTEQDKTEVRVGDAMPE
jgi:hypothetical protein